MEILIIDDDPELRAVLASIVLDASGVQPRTFCNGEVVLKYLQQAGADSCPVLAFVDVEMPGPDGMTVVKALKSHRARSFAVMMSANHGYETSAYDAGADHFLHKPFGLDDMLELIGRWSSEDLQGTPSVRMQAGSCVA